MKRIIVIGCMTIFISAWHESANSAELTEPGDDAASTQLALTDPDEYAWRLFLYLNHPAKIGLAGVADGGRKFGDDPEDGPVVWETWALESGRDHSELYHSDGSKPVAWEDLDRKERTLVLEPDSERLAVLSSSTLITPRFDALAPADEEVRTNKAMYTFIRNSGLYNDSGVQSLFDRARSEDNRKALTFPAGAKEIKAVWLPIKDEDKNRYLWREGEINGSKKIFGLVAFHVLTKDLPNWFWADFGHVDCESNKGACDNEWLKSALGRQYRFQEPTLTDPRDATTRGDNAPSGKDGVRKETVGTVWENYILRGTQIDFVTPWGEQTILSNPVIENGFQQSSCLTCHARASIGQPLRNPNGRINTLSPGDPELGAPNRTLYGAGPGLSAPFIQYLQTDFVWSLPFWVRPQQ